VNQRDAVPSRCPDGVLLVPARDIAGGLELVEELVAVLRRIATELQVGQSAEGLTEVDSLAEVRESLGDVRHGLGLGHAIVGSVSSSHVD